MVDGFTTERRGPIIYVTLTHCTYDRPAECGPLTAMFDACIPEEVTFPWFVICFTAVRMFNVTCMNALRRLAVDCSNLGGHVAAVGLTPDLRSAFAEEGLTPFLVSLHRTTDDAEAHFIR